MTNNVLKINGKAQGTDNPTKNSTDYLRTKDILDFIYPVGSIYLSTTNTNPGTFMGGTWTSFGLGRTLIGVDPNDTLFNAADNTGGSKDAIVVNHSHTFTGSSGVTSSNGALIKALDNGGKAISPIASKDGDDGGTSVTLDRLGGENMDYSSDRDSRQTAYRADHTHTYTPSGTISTNGSSGTNKNLPPYITCYMWKRIS